VNVAPSTLLALMDRLRETGSPADPAEAVDAAIRHWLATSPGTPPVEPRGPATEARAADGTPPPAVRNTAPGHGWMEPERRKYRFRIEDVAFD
jgi:hypothetical protein